MKHYSAELNENNDVVTGANLEIADGRTRGDQIIAGNAAAVPGTSISADNIDGFIITGGNYNHILDGQGSSFDPKANNIVAYARQGNLKIVDPTDRLGADATAPVANLDLYYRDSSTGNAENIVANAPSTNAANAYHGLRLNVSQLLSVRGGRVDGTDLDLHSVTGLGTGTGDFDAEFSTLNRLARIDVSALVGGSGGAGAATNQTDSFMPVKVTRNSVDSFDDSNISITIADKIESTGLESNYTVAANGTSFALTGNSIQAFVASPTRAGFENGEIVYLSHPGNGSTISAQQIRVTVNGNSTANNVTLTLGAASADLETLAGLDTAMFAVTRDGAPGAISMDGDVTISGSLVVSGDNTILNTATTITEEKYFAVNQPDADGDGDPTDERPAAGTGGYLVSKRTATTLEDNLGAVQIDADAANNTGIFGGIRFNESGVTGTGTWEISQGTDANGNGSWRALSTHAGTVSKGVVLASIASGGTAITAGTASSFNGSQVADVADITVANDTTSGLQIAVAVATGTEFPFNSNDLTVQVYEDNSMIIPNSVTVSGNCSNCKHSTISISSA